MSKKIAISTGGGDAPGLNAVIRAVTLTAHNVYGWETVGLRNGFDGVMAGEPPILLSLERVRDIVSRGGTILGAANRGNPFQRPLQQPDGSFVHVDESDRVVEHMQKEGIEAIILAGGDGTMAIAQMLYEKGVPVVGVPKTIDNDLGGTDRTFGFDTALNIVTEALDRLHTTAESHHRVMFLEVMGRHAGWIALHAGVAGDADVILVPEIPFTIEAVCEKVRQVRASGRLHSLIVVAEGAAPAGGTQQFYIDSVDGQEGRLGGIAQLVSQQITRCLDVETRVTVLGHIQRGGTPTNIDRWLGTRFGANVVHLVKEEKWGYMVGLRGDEIVHLPIAEAIAELKRIEPQGEPVRTARGLGISFGDES
ncbi:MAG: ATP-dependent 6-phosphofructokinase [Anaerolineae bacterium]|nr:ATP-dependent 6-phosphofructokinase [Anaerolineae bacterium]